MTNKDLFARAALAQIPKMLTLLDRNPHSPLLMAASIALFGNIK